MYEFRIETVAHNTENAFFSFTSVWLFSHLIVDDEYGTRGPTVSDGAAGNRTL